MAGDWIAMQSALWDCPEVVRILSAMCPQNVRIERDSNCAPCPQPVLTVSERSRIKCQIIGALFRTWTLFDAYSDDGELPGYDAATLNEYVGIENWAENLQHVGWLTISPQSLSMPDFERWMSKSAKRRMQDADRKRRERKKPPESTSATCPNSVRKMSASSVTREEKRREENKYTHTHGRGRCSNLFIPEVLNQSPSFLEALDSWIENLFTLTGSVNPHQLEQHLRECVTHGVPRAIEVIRYTIGRGGKSLYWDAPDANGKKPGSSKKIKLIEWSGKPYEP
jgi:hypothetical protein